MKKAALIFGLFLCAGIPTNAMSREKLSDTVKAEFHAPLAEVGSSTYRRFGFKVYVASLWAPDGVYDEQRPYALQLRYTRSVSKDTLVDTTTDNLRDQKVADDDRLAEWEKVLNKALPDVDDGDTITGICMPGKASELFYNGKKVASISDQVFSRAFFNIWLGDYADEDMRNGLLGKKSD